MADYGWGPYVSVAERRRKAERAMEQQRRKGLAVAPVIIKGRAIAATFWGKAWCENLERYSDYANRLPRGRTYVRNGSVIDLRIAPGLVEAQVSGSSIYQVRVTVRPVPDAQWQGLCRDCGGAVASLVELLQGRFNQGVMERLCRQGAGLFPAPREIHFSCSCPDGAYMCKHVAAVLYGIGARFDAEPELLFLLRGVEGRELLAHAAAGAAVGVLQPATDRILQEDDLAALFGLDLAAAPEAGAALTPPGKKEKPKVGPAKAATAKPGKPKASPAKVAAAKPGKPKASPAKVAAVKPGKPKASPAKAAAAKPEAVHKAKPRAKPGNKAPGRVKRGVLS
jgi:uncharacterized Zn finger protein